MVVVCLFALVFFLQCSLLGCSLISHPLAPLSSFAIRVCSSIIVRLLLALAALEDWELEALDIKTAFLYGELDQEIYMEQPEGFIKDRSKVWKLLHALYGLKQASLEWWKQFG